MTPPHLYFFFLSLQIDVHCQLLPIGCPRAPYSPDGTPNPPPLNSASLAFWLMTLHLSSGHAKPGSHHGLFVSLSVSHHNYKVLFIQSPYHIAHGILPFHDIPLYPVPIFYHPAFHYYQEDIKYNPCMLAFLLVMLQ